MNFRFHPRRVMTWPLVTMAVFAGTQAIAQRPNSEGSDQQPSDYRYPLQTWTQRERITIPGPFIRDPGVHANEMSKLQSIVIPRIEFRSTALSDAVEYLRRESFRLDPDPNPATRGVNIVLQLQKPPSFKDTLGEAIPGLPLADAASHSAGNPECRITLTMERLPLLEALRYVASQAGVRVAVEPDKVSIVPLTGGIAPVLTTREYKAAPEVVGLPPNAGGRVPQDVQSQGGEVAIRRIDMVPWLRSQGVVFPEGTSATYLPTTGKLVVRNTPDNLDIIGAIIFSAQKAPGPQNP